MSAPSIASKPPVHVAILSLVVISLALCLGPRASQGQAAARAQRPVNVELQKTGVATPWSSPQPAKPPLVASSTPIPSPTPSPSPTTTAGPSCQRQPAWAVVESPNDFNYDDTELQAISASGPNDVWAVGGYGRCDSYHCNYYLPQPFIAHWDGRVWTRVPAATTGLPQVLKGVAAVSTTDAWAVGSTGYSPNLQFNVEHWDGSHWSAASTPGTGDLSAVAAISANDVWAVGSRLGIGYETFTLHWDGTTWSLIPSPSIVGSNNYLTGVAGVASNDVWAIGHTVEATTQHPMAMHWDGAAWTMVDLPDLPAASALNAVAAIATNDVWAVGENGSGSPTLIAHWDGSMWSTVSHPGWTGWLTGIDAAASNDVWAVGDSASGVRNALHWDGATWRDVPLPETYGDNHLRGVSVTGQGEVWAAGELDTRSDPRGNVKTLALHWHGAQWDAMQTADVTIPVGMLRSVDAVSASAIWAVGDPILHWDGTQWGVVPRVWLQDEALLNAVSAVSSNDVWAVGAHYVNPFYPVPPNYSTLVEHWNGTAWSVVPSPDYYSEPPGSKYLYAVAGVSANDAWAVGYEGGGYQPLTLRWDGTQWNKVPNPGTGTLMEVAAISANDVWAVGDDYAGSLPSRMLLEHWDGSEWNLIPAPSIEPDYAHLRGVAAVATNDVWAIGDRYNPSDGLIRPLIVHWDGSQWSVVLLQSTGTRSITLTSAAAISANDVWAVGMLYDQNAGAQYPVVLHWDGSQWSLVSVAQPGGSYDSLSGVTAVSGADVWAVGGAGGNSLVMHYSRDFGDVLPGSTFYQHVQCLACRGIISGYPDGSFRPNNPVTRGQLAKIVSNSAGYNENYTTATFVDVPVGSTFHLFVERLASRGYVAGYTCGGPGEPCPGLYFRPNANVSRGQSAKIVASARGLPPPSPGRQTFEDVAPNSTFWQWIEALASSGVIGGYPCGGQGEPCVPPNNRPYFRPGANVSRGQSAKIVASSFFPGCYSAAGTK